jgi:hypothetical protein
LTFNIKITIVMISTKWKLRAHVALLLRCLLGVPY